MSSSDFSHEGTGNRLTFNSLGDSIVVTDSQGFVVTWNRKAESVFGYSAEEIQGRPLSQVFPDLLSRIGLAEATGLVQTKGLTKNGNEIAVEISAETSPSQGQN